MIKNREQLLSRERDDETRTAIEIALDLLEEGIRAADPVKAVLDSVKLGKNYLIIFGKWKRKITKKTKIIVVGAGKASGAMAYSLEKILGKRITKGVVNVPEEFVREYGAHLKRIELNAAGHPLTNEGSIEGAKKILDLLEGVTEKDLVICLISGGGSALLELPFEWIPLRDLQQVFKKLSAAGATIHELNTIRKHLSRIKGGQLAKAAQPATVVSLIISDVVGDTLDAIASGPTVPDHSSWLEVKEVISKYNLWEEFPDAVKETVRKGLHGELKDTPKPGEVLFNNVHNFLIANNSKACNAMAKLAHKLGLRPAIISTTITGEAREIGSEFAKKLKQEDKLSVIIAGGETTVNVKGTGLGGRNQEVALSAARQLKGMKGAVLASIGSDGIDGPTDAAGAIVDGKTAEEGEKKGLIINHFLENNDAYHFFQKVQGLIFTGATGTNIMDLLVAVKV